MRNLKGPPATSEARPTTSEGAWAFFFPDNAAMPTIYIFNISFAIVEIKKCANLQQIRSERVKPHVRYAARTRRPRTRSKF